MRSFIAIPLPGEVLAQLESAVRSLEELRLSGRGVRAGAMHLTLKFLGSVSEDFVGQIAAVLRRLAGGVEPFEIVVNGADAFPHRRGPRVVFMSVQRCPALMGLQSAVEDRLTALGFKREEREYRAHLTLMRLKSPKHLSRLQDWFTRDLPVNGDFILEIR